MLDNSSDEEFKFPNSFKPNKKITYDSPDDEEANHPQQALKQKECEEEEKEFKAEEHQDFVQQRTQKIQKVQTSLGKISKMYQSLNEIVAEQG